MRREKRKKMKTIEKEDEKEKEGKEEGENLSLNVFCPINKNHKKCNTSEQKDNKKRTT